MTDPNANIPVAVAVDSATNRIYVANSASSNITVIEGGNNSIKTVSDPNAEYPVTLAVNSMTNQIYVANANSNNVTVIDGATNQTTTLTAPNQDGPYGLAVNPLVNKIYVANRGSNNLTVIDGATNAVLTIFDAKANDDVVAFDPVNHKAYVGGGASVTAFADQQAQEIPIQVAIQPLLHNRTQNPKPTFTFKTSDAFKPNRTEVDNLLFQMDTWQGPWIAASNKGSGEFQGQVTLPLTLGIHILYAYATDGQDATSTNTGQQSSPLIGNIKPYVFLVY